MPYVVKAGNPRPLNSDEQAKFRKEAWDHNKNWWAAALFLFVIAIPSIMILPGVICIVASILVFMVTLVRVESHYSGSVASAEKRSRESSFAEAARHTEQAKQHMKTMNEAKEVVRRQLDNASTSISKAHDEFCSKAYTLFWDNLERAAHALWEADFAQRSITRTLREYHEILKSHDHTFPKTPVNLENLPDRRVHIGNKMKAIIRTGLENEKCAMFWEYWRGRRDSATIDQFVGQL